MSKFGLQDLAAAIAKKHGLEQDKTEVLVKTFFETIEEGLYEDKSVKIKGLGTFKVVEVEPRESVNVNTGERVVIEGHEKIKGKPVIFISMDKTIPENQLMDRYLSNLEHKKDPGTVQDVRMIFLNMDQISFADWLKINRKFYKEAIKNKKQTKGKGVYENKYLAARALANII